MASTAALAIGKASAERRISVAVLGLVSVALTVGLIAESIVAHKAEVSARAARPLFVLMTPSGRAQVVDFGSISQTALTSVVQTSLIGWTQGMYGCNPKMVSDDRFAAWAILSPEQRAAHQQEFQDSTAKCASRPTEEIRIANVIPTIHSPEPLKAGGTYRALIGFEMVYISDGRETRREIQTATVQFTIGGQPSRSDSFDLQRANPVGISIDAFRTEREL